MQSSSSGFTPSPWTMTVHSSPRPSVLQPCFNSVHVPHYCLTSFQCWPHCDSIKGKTFFASKTTLGDLDWKHIFPYIYCRSMLPVSYASPTYSSCFAMLAPCIFIWPHPTMKQRKNHTRSSHGVSQSTSNCHTRWPGLSLLWQKTCVEPRPIWRSFPWGPMKSIWCD